MNRYRKEPETQKRDRKKRKETRAKQEKKEK